MTEDRISVSVLCCLSSDIRVKAAALAAPASARSTLRTIIEEMLMPMKNPSHPGEVFYWSVLEPLGVSVSEAARLLGVRRATLSAVVNARASLSPDLALRIEKAFGPKVDLMLRIQAAYDAAQVRKREKQIKVKRYVANAAA